ncbi:MAG TPA: alpha/beta hydrolase [Blastocatellia bacterium]|nr:alpha/beta hydrolase [Blastocatellia bacterium]
MMKRITIIALLVVSTIAASYARQTTPAKLQTKIETGQINGAPFYIEVPDNWNRGLVMYCHGYEMPGNPPVNWNDEGPKKLREVFLSRGFAFAASAYRTQGWAVKEALEDTEALRRYFIKKHGQPRETFITGHSMGGHLSMAIIEKYPNFYDGALPLCGPLGAAVDFMERRVFDMLVTFEYYFPGTIGSPVDVAMDRAAIFASAGKAKAAMDAAPEKAEMFARHFNVSVKELPQVLGFFKLIMAEMKQRAGGNPFDNRNTIYSGFDDDAAVNRGVKRYAADQKARDYLRQYYTPTGRITDPVLTVHTTYDQLVPASDVNNYDSLTAIAGAQDLFVERFVVASGHCNIASEKIAAAFDALLAWVHEHKRPASGEIP